MPLRHRQPWSHIRPQLLIKRVKNDRIKQELGVTLRYPTYREGLRALYEAGEGRSAK